MPSERMGFWQRWMIEIISRVATHPKPIHDCSRSVVPHRCVRYDIPKGESSKPVAKCQSSRLGCITVSPMLEGQTPTDFYTRGERGRKSFDGQAGEPDEWRHVGDLDGPQTEAVFAEMCQDAIHH